jgi:DNA-binding YbaB/EbfC family protein
MGGFFNQAKDLYKLQKEARTMQKKMKQIKISGLSDDEYISVVMDGTQEIEEINIDDSLLSPDKKRELIRSFKQAFKDAQRKLQKEMMKDKDISQIKNMLG